MLLKTPPPHERLPCKFATVDLADIMGTSLTNVTAEIIKFRVAPDAGHKQEFYVEEPRAVKHEELDAQELALFRQMPDNVPQVHRGRRAEASGTPACWRAGCWLRLTDAWLFSA